MDTQEFNPTPTPETDPPISAPGSTGEPPAPWDREFNIAIKHMASKVLPRGFATLPRDVWQAMPTWEHYIATGRPVVAAVTEIGTNPFADTETIMEFEALMQELMFGGSIGETHKLHQPDVCPDMLLAAADRLTDLIFSAYGDDKRTRQWRQAVYFLTVGLLAFDLLFGRGPESLTDYLRTMVSKAAAQESVQETRDGVRAMVEQAAMFRLQVAQQEARKDAGAAAHTDDDETPTKRVLN